MPVLNQSRYTKEILEYFERNTVKPDNIIVIDNASDDDTGNLLADFSNRLPIIVLRQEENIGVNASWNLGLNYSEADVVSVLNNDLILPPFFFEKIHEAFDRLPDCGYVIPITLQEEKYAREATNGRLEWKEQGMREGWAFTMRRIVFCRQGPIPSQVFTFFGDDYLYWMTRRCGFLGYKLTSVPIYHYLSKTLYHSRGAQEEWGPDYQKWDHEVMPNIPNRKRDWEQVPHNGNLSPYSMFYLDTFMQACKSVPSGELRTTVECESPFGCSTRMFKSAMAASENYKIVIFGKDSNEHLDNVLDSRVKFFGPLSEEGLNAIENDSVMLVHIDCEPHDYIYTSYLFELFRKKLRKGGYFLFHDCSDHFTELKRFVIETLGSTDTWRVELCPPHEDSPISVPARALKL